MRRKYGKAGSRADLQMTVRKTDMEVQHEHASRRIHFHDEGNGRYKKGLGTCLPERETEYMSGNIPRSEPLFSIAKKTETFGRVI